MTDNCIERQAAALLSGGFEWMGYWSGLVKADDTVSETLTSTGMAYGVLRLPNV